MDCIDDGQLLAMIGRGRQWAFERLLRRYQRPLLRFLYAMTADRDLAEELFQETFVTIATKAADFQPTGSASGWIYTIARNKAFNAVAGPARGRRAVLRLDDATALETAGATAPVDRAAGSELQTAFMIGFRIYLPFLIIDMVVASLLISMGMLMLPPVLISLPFKLLLFVLVDGWHRVVGGLLESFRVTGGA